jgi:hypothetical protein
MDSVTLHSQTHATYANMGTQLRKKRPRIWHHEVLNKCGPLTNPSLGPREKENIGKIGLFWQKMFFLEFCNLPPTPCHVSELAYSFVQHAGPTSSGLAPPKGRYKHQVLLVQPSRLSASDCSWRNSGDSFFVQIVCLLCSNKNWLAWHFSFAACRNLRPPVTGTAGQQKLRVAICAVCDAEDENMYMSCCMN